MLINLIVVITSQCIRSSKHRTVPLKYTQLCLSTPPQQSQGKGHVCPL